jgi:pentose-5-phosphate-3-epimerase
MDATKTRNETCECGFCMLPATNVNTQTYIVEIIVRVVGFSVTPRILGKKYALRVHGETGAAYNREFTKWETFPKN